MLWKQPISIPQPRAWKWNNEKRDGEWWKEGLRKEERAALETGIRWESLRLWMDWTCWGHFLSWRSVWATEKTGHSSYCPKAGDTKSSGSHGPQGRERDTQRERVRLQLLCTCEELMLLREVHSCLYDFFFIVHHN